MEEQVTLETEKKKLGILPKIFIAITIVLILLACYMFLLEPKLLITREYAVVNESIPDSFNGFKIVQFSDIHFGRTTNEKEVQKVVQEINLQKPDLLVFTGDLFDSYINLSEDNVEFLKTELAKTTATIGKYAIFGDSDYLNISLYEEIMKEAGFTILTNQNIPIYYEGTTPIYLSGIPTISQGNQDLTKAFVKENDEKAYQILLMHEPVLFQEVKSKSQLVLAGHSLGGLIHIPFVGGVFKKENTGEYDQGMYTGGSSVMYVSNGIGTEDLSVRFLNIPSISLYRLYNYE